MKKIRNKVLTLLLLTFAFFVVHDYVVEDVNQDAIYELSYKAFDKADMQDKIHESIHNIFTFNLEEASTKDVKLLDVAPCSITYSLSSNVNPVPQRPPLS
ncbi:MAG: hypothetical protein M0Q24_03625 [Sulfurimonas sp.]|uniref:hypothetical protein n=1 Tax=Sulfurimonas sp. TaxID=2022749 RepID=UPI0025D12D4F|nr:hypothetical protein [Sulfurimonas sp.]MCK9491158.1 hypothetical protein [Sulfurimonas sp.]